MKFAVAFVGALFASASALTGGAADTPQSGLTDEDAGTGGDGSVPSSGNDSGAPPPTHDAGASTCVATCNTNDECQSSCSPVNNGLNCCDSAHVCFQWSGTACPAQAQDSGANNPPY